LYSIGSGKSELNDVIDGCMGLIIPVKGLTEQAPVLLLPSL